MFISNQEKATLSKSIENLQKVLADVLVDVTMLKAKMKIIEAKKKTEEVLVKRDIAAEDRKAKQRAYARKYYAKKKLASKQKKDPNVGS